VTKPKTIHTLATLLLLATGLPAHASEDFVRWTSRGDALLVEIYKDADTGAYRFTRIIVAVAPDDPTLFPAPNDYFVVNCDGNEGGDLSNCLYPGAFLASSACAPIVRTTYSTPFFMGHPIQDYVIVDQYRCKTGAPRGAGECVEFEGSILHVFTQSTGNQVLWPWVETMVWPAEWDCAAK
jgi:hypothetical protein